MGWVSYTSRNFKQNVSKKIERENGDFIYDHDLTN